MTAPPLATGQRRFYLDRHGAVMVAGRWFPAREATDEDLRLLDSFARRVIERPGGWWDLPSWHWLVNRVLARATA